MLRRSPLLFEGAQRNQSCPLAINSSIELALDRDYRLVGSPRVLVGVEHVPAFHEP
jgi:hypothetical protein